MSATNNAAGHATATTVGRFRDAAHFVLHFIEMCVPMCVGFAVGDALYFWIASLAGYSEPFGELPVLSVVLVTIS